MENKWKWISIGVVGSIVSVSHIGMIGMLVNNAKNESKLPDITVPTGPYTIVVECWFHNTRKLDVDDRSEGIMSFREDLGMHIIGVR